MVISPSIISHSECIDQQYSLLKGPENCKKKFLGLGPRLGLFLPRQGLALARQCIILISRSRWKRHRNAGVPWRHRRIFPLQGANKETSSACARHGWAEDREIEPREVGGKREIGAGKAEKRSDGLSTSGKRYCPQTGTHYVLFSDVAASS